MIIGEEVGRLSDPVATSSVQDVMATEPVIRRVVASRVRDPHDVDDLVHDCLERLLLARGRLAPETVLPFGIVTARNLVTSRARSAATRTHGARHSLVSSEPDRPEDTVVADEARAAMAAALAQLAPHERTEVLAYQDHGTRYAGPGSESPGALRVRMARTRAKLRLEYLLALRRVTLPSPLCRRVLLAVSAGDTRRQRALGAGGHLLDCETCAALAEPLEKRSLALTAVAFPIAMAAWLASKARAHPVVTAATAVAAAGAIAAGTILAPSPATSTPGAPSPATATPGVDSARPLHPAARTPVARTPVARTRARTTPPTTRVPATTHGTVTGQLVEGLSINGSAVAANSSLRSAIGQQVEANEVRVDEVVTHDGFWIGSSRSARVWVEFVGPLRSLQVVTGDRLRFTGTVRANGPDYPARAGVTVETGASQLSVQGAHIDVSTTAVRVLGP